MKVAVSACLLGVPCRYDGKAKPCAAVREFLETHVSPEDVVRVCPEVMGGLKIPHPPSEIQTDLLPEVVVHDVEGTDTTKAFELGAQVALNAAQQAGCTHAILKAKSPSCGVGKIYDGTFTDTLVEGNGVAAQAFIDAGIIVSTEDDFQEVFS
ncbi:DUF523 domain-containing protein [Anaerotardibacter muris]|uniref:DUF523 domain-containing protein n=1 Tax=Anaerotardibacter muris TaxID=2941505 RepID=UPI00203D2B06|nr:DUF523 domain-containing protein [Anaerotardibacter muris]